MNMDNNISKIKPKEAIDLDNTLTEAQKASILSKTLIKIQEDISDSTLNNLEPLQAKRKGLKRRLIFILAAALIISAITVMASDNPNIISRFKEILKLTEENQRLIDGMWSEINQSKTIDGYTVTLVGTLGDDSSLALSFDVKFPEGTDLDNEYSFDILQLDNQHWYGLGLYGGMQMISPLAAKVDKANSTISYIYKISSETGDYRNSKLRFSLKDLYTNTPYGDYENRKLISDGEWVFYFNLDYSANTAIYNADRTVKGGINTIDIKQIKLSPLSITIIGKSDDYENDMFAFLRGNADLLTGLMMKNGDFISNNSDEEYSFGNGSFSTTVPRNNKMAVYYKATFNNIIDPDEIESVVIYDQEFKLSDLQLTDEFNNSGAISSSKSTLIISLSSLISLTCFLSISIEALIETKSSLLEGYEKARTKLAKKQKRLSFKTYIRKSRRDRLISAYLLIPLDLLYGAIALYLISLIIRNMMLWQTVVAAIIATIAVALGICGTIAHFKSAFSMEKYFKV